MTPSGRGAFATFLGVIKVTQLAEPTHPSMCESIFFWGEEWKVEGTAGSSLEAILQLRAKWSNYLAQWVDNSLPFISHCQYPLTYTEDQTIGPVAIRT